MKYTLSVLVENQPGVLSKVVALFSRRGYNIDSLAVGHAENEAMSRITMVVNGDAQMLEQVEKQLNKLIPVIKVRNLTNEGRFTACGLVLVKVSCDPKTSEELLQITRLMEAQVLHVTPQAVTLRFVGDSDKTATLIDLLRPYGIQQIARVGQLALEN